MATKVVQANAVKDMTSLIITNRSRQMIPLQVRQPHGDFFYEERQVRIGPGKSVTILKRYVDWKQLENIRGRGDIAVREG